MRLAWATIAAIIATVAAACGVAASLPASIVIIEPLTVSISNETSTLAVKVMVNGNEVGIFQPGERADPIDQSRLPSPPWHVVATTLSGRPLTAYDVKPGDVTTIPIAANQVSQEAVLDARALVGQTPRRPLRERQPILMSDVRAPVLVTKGAAVTMVLESPGLLLTAKGQELEDGAKGETIRIMNTQSNRTVEAVVTAAGAARVSASGAVVR